MSASDTLARPPVPGAPYVGAPVARAEDPRFLTGTGQFADDVTRPGLLHAAVLRSSNAHGRIVLLDVEAARALEGVHAVLIAADLGEVPLIPIRLAPLAEYEAFRQPVIAADKVRYVGEPIAVVVAESRAIAEDALELIELEIDALPVAADTADARDAEGEALLFAGTASNVAASYLVRLGDADAVFAAAPYVRTERFSTQRHTALPMETRGLVAEFDPASRRLVVTGAAKVPFFNRKALAGMLGLPLEAVDLIEVDVGGGFGVRGEMYPEDVLIPFAALRLGRPVKWIEDRREHLLACNHSREIDCTLSIACDRDGTMLALKGTVEANMGAYIRTNGGVVPAKAGQFLPGPYRIRDVAVEVLSIVSNKTPVGTYRGPGRFEANFFRERLIDLAAADLGLDPAEMRMKNLITEAELPWDTGKLVPYEAESAFDTGDYPAAFARCLAEIGWEEKKALQGALVDGRRHGIGLGCFVESGGAGPRENARLTLEADGSLTVAVGSSALGQGIETVHAQVAADALGLPPERIRVLHGSTTLLHEGFGTYHSRAVIMGGSAILDAARKLRAALLEAAAVHLGLPNTELTVADGRITAASGAGVDFATLAGHAHFTAEGTFENGNTRTYSYGAHAAHVVVDPRTGDVELLDYVAVEDVGVAVNPMIVHGQAIGAIVQGLGGVFLDHLIYDSEGQLLNGSLADYLVPTATDFAHVRAVTLELRRSPSNPLGAKGAGEGGIVAVAAAAANAVAAALRPLGVAPNHLPLTPPRLWQLLQEARRGHSSSAL
ncbi:MAG: xanthine dehydrogenase family protein [Rhizobiales bacterium]|nr:xanthine dehydrogenase family protein [Hyphomicrobiales bacterium]